MCNFDWNCVYFANNQILGLCTFLFTLYVLQTTHVYKDIFFRNEFIFYAPAWCRVAVLLLYTGCKWVMCLSSKIHNLYKTQKRYQRPSCGTHRLAKRSVDSECIFVTPEAYLTEDRLFSRNTTLHYRLGSVINTISFVNFGEICFA